VGVDGIDEPGAAHGGCPFLNQCGSIFRQR
jgi:hypothetical protein